MYGVLDGVRWSGDKNQAVVQTRNSQYDTRRLHIAPPLSGAVHQRIKSPGVALTVVRKLECRWVLDCWRTFFSNDTEYHVVPFEVALLPAFSALAMTATVGVYEMNICHLLVG